MARISVKQIEQPLEEFSAAQTLAKLCYYYPQYTIETARPLPFRQVKLLLRQAKNERYINYIRELEIASASQQGNEAMVSLADHYRQEII